MGFFSKKITTDIIIASLVSLVNTHHSSFVNGFKDLLKKEQGTISKEQDKELLIIPMLAIIRAVYALGDTPEIARIIGGFSYEIFNQYYPDAEERKKFEKLFNERLTEYYKIFDPEDKDLAIHLGQIFCTHFFGEEEDGSHLAMMMFVGTSFLTVTIETKKFLDKISSSYEIV